jgi:hypothetical protein
MSKPDHNRRHRFITDPYGARHYEKLGRFIFQYAQAEAHFHLAFRFYSQMPIAEARMLFGGPSRISDVIDRTKRLMELYKIKQELIDDFEDIVHHFKEIGLVRDRIIHRGWRVYGDAFSVSDIVTARIKDDAKIFRVTLAEMDDMIEDLIRIWMRIYYRHIGDDGQGLQQPPSEWCYNPPGRGNTRKQSRKGPRNPSSSP